MRYPALNRALRGGLGRMGDTSSDNQVSDNNPNDTVGGTSLQNISFFSGVFQNPSDSSSVTLVSNGAGGLVSPGTVAGSFGADQTPITNSASTATSKTSTTPTTTANWVTYATIAAGLLMFAYLAKGK